MYKGGSEWAIMTENKDLDSGLLYDGYKKFGEIPMINGEHRFRFEVDM